MLFTNSLLAVYKMVFPLSFRDMSMLAFVLSHSLLTLGHDKTNGVFFSGCSLQ